jgi:ketosteroid isomerase-like protein
MGVYEQFLIPRAGSRGEPARHLNLSQPEAQMAVRRWFQLGGLASVVVLLAACGGDASETQAAPPAGEAPATGLAAEYSQISEQYRAAWNGADVEAVARHFAEDATARVGDDTYTGRDQIRSGWLEPAVSTVSNLQVTESRVAERDGGIVDEGTYSATISPPDADSFQQTGTYVNTWARNPDGGMRIVSSIVEPDPRP